jgi:hypothetical protein
MEFCGNKVNQLEGLVANRDASGIGVLVQPFQGDKLLILPGVGSSPSKVTQWHGFLLASNLAVETCG